MATTVVKNVITGSTANANNYASGSFTPVVGDLLFVISHATGSIEPAVSHTCTASANSITFTQISRLEHTLSGNVSFMYVADQLVPSSPASMTVSSNHSTDAATGCFVACGSVTGMTFTGATAVKQSALSPNLGANAAWTATFGAATLTTNPLVGFEGDAGGVSGTTTPPTSWTEIDEPAEQATPAQHFEWAKSDSGLTATAYTWTYSVSTVRANVAAWEFDSSTGAAAGDRILVQPPRRP